MIEQKCNIEFITSIDNNPKKYKNTKQIIILKYGQIWRS